MTALQLISQLGAKGIKLWLDDQGQLRFKAPKGAMDAHLKTQVVALKTELIAFLKSTQSNQDFSIRPLSRSPHDEFPLSFAQQRFWFLDRLEPGNPALHIPAAVNIKGALHLPLFAKAFQLLLNRHEALRTYFVTDENHHVSQKIDDDVQWKIREDYDLSHLDEEKANKQVQQILKDEALRPFDLNKVKIGKPVFIRTKLIRLYAPSAKDQAFVFIINLHHIIADGWSMNLLIQELCHYYLTLISQGDANLPPLSVQYVDYAHWQKQWIQSQAFTDQLTYWQDQLENTPLLTLPTDYPRPDHASFHGDSVEIAISKELTKKLHALKDQFGCTLFSLLLGAYQILLMRHSGQQDFAVGIPVAGRKQSETEVIIGCFINLLAIRAPLDAESTLPEFLTQLQNTLISAQDNQDIPFESVTEAFSSHRSLSHHPIFQVLFTLQKSLLTPHAMGEDLELSQVPFRSVTAKYDLQLHIDESEETLGAIFEFNTDLFDRTHIQDLARHFVNLLWSIARAPTGRLIDFEIYDEDDFQRFLPTQRAAHVPKRLLAEQYETLSLKRPEQIAVSQGSQSITFEQLHQKANALAALLLAEGAQAGERIAICLPAGIDSIVAILAVMKTTAAYVPMDTGHPKERLALIFESANPLLVITHSDFSESSLAHKQLLIDQLSLDETVSIPEPKATFDAPFYTIFTSGSTGKPKGVSVSQANIYNLVHWYKNNYAFDANDKFLIISALGFDLTQKNMLLPLLIGAEIVFPESSTYDPQHISDTIYQKNISVLNCVPSAFYPIVDHCQRNEQMYALSSLSHLLFGGEPINLPALKPWINSPCFNARIINMYGPTECTDISTTFTLDPVKSYYNQVIPIGQPIDGVSVYVLDKYKKLAPIGTAGELYIGGHGVAEGYLNQPEITEESFIDDPYMSKPGAKVYKTGDSVKYQLMANGALQLVFVGRLDDQIKIRGYRIEPNDIASRVQQHASVREALVLVDRHEENERLLAYFIPEEGNAVDLFQLRHYLKAYLPEYMLPQAFIEVRQWPLSANGKIDKHALPKPVSHDLVHNQYVAPGNLIEKQLCQLFGSKLAIEDVGIEDNFFELGGHSILATQLVGIIQNDFGVDLSVRTFFENPTIRALAGLIQAGKAVDDLQSDFPIIKVSRQSSLPLSPAQERLWIIEQMNPGNCAYLIPFAIRLTGSLHKEALMQAFQWLVNRHETLRTAIRSNAEGLAEQHILAADSIALDEITLSSNDNAYEDALTLINKDANTAFAMDQRLFRATLMTLTDDDHILSVCMHHMIADGWSLGILQKELLMAYDAFCNDRPVPIEPLTIQYADFSAWQRQYLQADKIQGHINYWLQQLDNAPALLSLPTDRPRPAQQTFNGNLISKNIDQDLKTRLTTFSQKQGISNYHTLMTVYFLLLQKYAHQDDICIGTPIAGRDKAECQPLIGYFVNTLIIRNDLSANPSFYELCQRTLDQCLGAFAHQDIPIEQVIEKLPLTRNLSYSPIAQVGFNLIDKSLFQQATIAGLDSEIIELNQVVAKYDLTLTLVDQEQGMTLHGEYNTDLFDQATIDGFLEHFITLLSHCIAEPDKQLNAFDILSNKQLLEAAGIDADTVERVLPLNAMQQDMLLAQSINPESRANTLGYRIEPRFSIDENLWEKALQAIACDEPSARTHFVLNPLPYGEFAYQYEATSATVALDVFDYRDKTLSRTDIDRLIDDFIYQPKAYTRQQFFRYGLIKISDDHNILLLSCHHGILDGISVAHIAQLTIDYYQALHQQQTPKKREAIDYKKYLLDNRAVVDNQAVLDFWQQRLITCEPLVFPHSSLDTRNNSERHRVKTLTFDQQEWQQITQFCRRKGTTPAIYLKMLYALLIANYCQAENDFYFTEFHAKRDNSNINELGCFFQQSPFIVAIDDLKKARTIDQLLASARDFQKKSKRYNALSKGMTQTLSAPGRLQFMFNYYHFLPEHFDILGQASACAETPPFVEGAVQFIIKALEDSTRLELYYQPALFNDLEFLPRLQLLNQQILTGKNTIGELKLLLHHEYMDQQFHWQNVAYNDTPLDAVISLATLLERQAEKTPDNIAVIEKNDSLTYKALHEKANQLAHYLRELGVGSDIRVAVCLDLGIDAMIAILAIIKAGGAYVPIDTGYPNGRIKHMLRSADIQLIICRKSFSDDHSLSDKTCIFMDANDDEQSRLIQAQANTHPETVNNIEDMLYVIFTSGSTGMPKGAAITHMGEINLQQWYCKSLKADEDSRFLVISSLGFDLTQKNLFAPLITGGQLILSATNNYDSHAIADTIQQHKITVLNCAPSMFYPLVEDHQNLDYLSHLDHLIFGGEPIMLEKLSRWTDTESFNATITNHYGPTECTDIACYFPINDVSQYLHKTPPIGRPNDNVKVYIINDQKQLLPTGLVGEIAISGKGVGRGYLNHDDLNHERFIASPFDEGQLYLTGDLGRWSEGGQLEFVARKDFQLKINGQRLEPGEIEHTLLHQSGVTDALVMMQDKQLVAYVVCERAFVDTSHWPSDLANYLPHYMIPKHFILLDEWPLNANGKVDRHALPPITSQSTERPYRAPRDDIESTIASIIANVLNQDKISVLDDFFEIGANSLSASRAMVQIREHYEIDVPLNLLFDLTTTEKLAAFIKASQWAKQGEDNDREGRNTGFI